MPLPEKNADGLPAVELTEEQKYVLDTKGWLVIPGVLTNAEVEEMRAFCYRLHRDRSFPDSPSVANGPPCR